MRLKKLALILLVSCFSCFSAHSVPTSNNIKPKNLIAIIDVQMILENSLAAQSIRNKIETISKEIQKEMDHRSAELKKIEGELSSKRNIIPEQEFEQELLKFNKKVSILQRQAQDRKGKLEQAYSEAISIVHEAIIKSTKDLAKERGFEVVVPISLVIYFIPTLNITEQIIEKLNTSLKDVKVNYSL